MRLIDADALRDYAFEVYQGNGVELETLMVVPLREIDNATTYNQVGHVMATAEGFITNPEWIKGDLISREALKEAIETYDKFACLPDCKLEPVRDLKYPEMFIAYIHIDDVIKAIDNAPTIEQEVYITGDDFNLYMRGYNQARKDFERPQGEKIKKKHYGWVYCSECDSLLGQQDKFCLNCGADMRGKKNE